MLLSIFQVNVLAEVEEPPEMVCGLDLNENGSFAEEGETTFCEPTTTQNIYSCPLGRVACHPVDIPVSSCLPRMTHIQNLERKAAAIAEKAALVAQAKADSATSLYGSLLSIANNLTTIATNKQVAADAAKAIYDQDILVGNNTADSLSVWLQAKVLAETSLINARKAITEAQDQLKANQPILFAAIKARKVADEAAIITTVFPTFYNRQAICPLTDDLFTAPFNPSREELALRDRSCALNCEGDAAIIERTVWISPLGDDRECINLLNPSYINNVTAVIDFEGAHSEPINMVVSPSNCYQKKQTFLDVSEEYYQDNETINNETGECNGEFQIFSGKVTGCRSNGYQTRWDNCCNNGEKIITDSFSEKTTAERLEGIATMVGDAIDGVSGSGIGSDIAKLISEGFSTLPTGLDPLEITGKIGNWIMTPCTKESESVSKMASDMCMHVGEKCIEKWFGIGCVQNAQVHCCFKTRLAKIFHEQARAQLPNMSWGNAQAANCRGFTPEEFQAIDFSKIDLGDYEPDVVHRPMIDLQSELTDGVPSISLPSFSLPGKGG
ncbi:MAG: conjugal transfer protein TraN [Alteromonadaceae bacterium]|nr:conjugal transfer protein TraN [Alteromonadaceae bacterium]